MHPASKLYATVLDPESICLTQPAYLEQNIEEKFFISWNTGQTSSLAIQLVKQPSRLQAAKGLSGVIIPMACNSEMLTE